MAGQIYFSGSGYESWGTFTLFAKSIEALKIIKSLETHIFEQIFIYLMRLDTNKNF